MESSKKVSRAELCLARQKQKKNLLLLFFFRRVSDERALLTGSLSAFFEAF